MLADRTKLVRIVPQKRILASSYTRSLAVPQLERAAGEIDRIPALHQAGIKWPLAETTRKCWPAPYSKTSFVKKKMKVVTNSEQGSGASSTL
jgi:hypothetical protein